MSIGKNIITVREKLNISQEELANIFEVSSRMVREYEKDKYSPNSEALKKLFTKYGINPTWFFLNKGQMLLENETIQQITTAIKNKYNLSNDTLDKIIQELIKSEDFKEIVSKLLTIKEFDKNNLKDIASMFELLAR